MLGTKSIRKLPRSYGVISTRSTLTELTQISLRNTAKLEGNTSLGPQEVTYGFGLVTYPPPPRKRCGKNIKQVWRFPQAYHPSRTTMQAWYLKTATLWFRFRNQ